MLTDVLMIPTLMISLGRGRELNGLWDQPTSSTFVMLHCPTLILLTVRIIMDNLRSNVCYSSTLLVMERHCQSLNHHLYNHNVDGSYGINHEFKSTEHFFCTDVLFCWVSKKKQHYFAIHRHCKLKSKVDFHRRMSNGIHKGTSPEQTFVLVWLSLVRSCWCRLKKELVHL